MALLFAFYVAQWTSVMVWLPTFLVDEHGISPPAPRRSPLRYGPDQRTRQPHWRLAARARRAARHNDRHRRGDRRAVRSSACWSTRCRPQRASCSCSPSRSRPGVIPASVFSGLPVHARTPQHIGTGNGIVMQASQIGQFFAPLALAWIATRFGWHANLVGTARFRRRRSGLRCRNRRHRE